MKYQGGDYIERVHPLPGMGAESCVGSGPGPWHSKMFHFVPDLPPSAAGAEIQSEFFVPDYLLVNALTALQESQHLFNSVLQIGEVRAIKQDTIPFSPANGR